MKLPRLRSPATAWILYDAAYSTFAFLFMTRYFPAWIVTDLHQPDWYVGAGLAAAVVLVVCLAPPAGRLADRRGLRKQLLLIFTLASSILAGTLSLVPDQHPALLVILGSASVMFGQLAVAQFDPLIAEVSDPAHRGRTSGLAVGLGFAGSLVGLGVLTLFLGSGSKQTVFLPLAVTYLVLALPVVVIQSSSRTTSQRAALAGQMSSSRAQARRFILARFLYCEAILTATGYMTVFMDRVGGFTEGTKSLVLGLAVIGAGGGAVATGYAMRRCRPITLILACLPVVPGSLMLIAVVPTPLTIGLAAPILGACLGVFWSADRICLLDLVPDGSRGEWFAYFNLANRLATAIGPLLVWGGSIWLLHGQLGVLDALEANRVSLVCLAALAVSAYCVARPLRVMATSPSD